MWIWITVALAGQLIVDGKVPVSVAIDGEMAAQTYRPGLLRFEVENGEHVVVISAAGNPNRFDIVVGPSAPVVLLAGRTGITQGAVDKIEAEDEGLVTGPGTVTFRCVGGARLMVQVGRQRVVVGAGEGVALELAIGEHPMSIRSSDGTSIYARGVLRVSGGAGPVVVQIGEGTMPETSGEGIAFLPDRT